MEKLNQNSPTDFIDTLLTSFEDRIFKIKAAFSTPEEEYASSNFLIKDFHQSLLALKTERTYLNSMLRENLAKNGSMRKNDYDNLMEEIFTFLNEREREAEYQFNRFIEDQRQMVLFLHHDILEINGIDYDDNIEKVTAFKSKLDNLLKSQQHWKASAITKFTEFRHIHQKFTGKFKQLLEPDVCMFCKDIKMFKKQLLEEIS
jgi:hypothetical protein